MDLERNCVAIVQQLFGNIVATLEEEDEIIQELLQGSWFITTFITVSIFSCLKLCSLSLNVFSRDKVPEKDIQR